MSSPGNWSESMELTKESLSFSRTRLLPTSSRSLDLRKRKPSGGPDAKNSKLKFHLYRQRSRHSVIRYNRKRLRMRS